MDKFLDFIVKLAEDWEARYQEKFYPKVQEIAETKKYPFKFMFKGKDRVVLPFSTSEVAKNDADLEIIIFLEDRGCSVNWKKGVATFKNKTVRIPKALKSAFRGHLQDQRNQMRLDSMLRNYEKSLSRSFLKKPQNLYIVISQNPHDIARMSYGRRWNSCMNLETGEYAPKKDETQEEREVNVLCEVERGGLIAYVTTEDDVDKLKKPVTRVLLRRFQNDLGQSVLVPEERIYGVPFVGLVDEVKQWISSNALDKPSRQLSLFFTPVFRQQGVPHSDTLPEYIVPSEYLEDVTYEKVHDLAGFERESLVTRLIEQDPNHPVLEQIMENSDDPNLLHLIASHVGEAYAPLVLINDNAWGNNARFAMARNLIATEINAKFLPFFLEKETHELVLRTLMTRLLKQPELLSEETLRIMAEKSRRINVLMLGNLGWESLSPEQRRSMYEYAPAGLKMQLWTPSLTT
jgi:hypothetical protein